MRTQHQQARRECLKQLLISESFDSQTAIVAALRNAGFTTATQASTSRDLHALGAFKRPLPGLLGGVYTLPMETQLEVEEASPAFKALEARVARLEAFFAALDANEPRCEACAAAGPEVKSGTSTWTAETDSQS